MGKIIWHCLTEHADEHIERIKRLSYVSPDSVTSRLDSLRGWTEITADFKLNQNSSIKSNDERRNQL
jgi:hypothetical protein